MMNSYDSRRPVEVVLCRLDATHLGPPAQPLDTAGEFYTAEEYYSGEFY